jgi:hypothetical protein
LTKRRKLIKCEQKHPETHPFRGVFVQNTANLFS